MSLRAVSQGFGTEVITGGTIDGAAIGGTTPAAGAFTTLAASSTVSGTGFSTYLASPPAIGATVAAAGTFTTATSATTNVTNNLKVANKVLVSATAPTIASGFGSSPSIVASNGTAAFTVNVGTGGTASSGVITMPTATTGWIVDVSVNGAPQAGAITYSATTSTTSITITNYTIATGIALAWPSGTVLQCTAVAY